MQDVLQKDDFIDGLHPNQKGHKKMFERIKKHLNE
jgi:lysophospholipase L1-like esterase